MSDWGSRAWQMVKETRFVAHDPEQLWAMVEPADGAAATELGELLTQAAKTINDIGSDLRTHSMAVEWDGEGGEGGEAFRTWCNQAALATLGLGDYSETAGKWLGHAADTLHEVKPQLEILRKQSATARSVLDAHAAKATDVGNHDGGLSATEVETAKTRYANGSADAAGLMIKLAQSYTASTEQIDALVAPEFPELPKQFVPTKIDSGTHVPAPAAGGGTYQETVARAKTPGREQAGADPSVNGTTSAPTGSTARHLTDLADVPNMSPRPRSDTTNTAIDSVETLPSAPAVHSAASVPQSGLDGPEGRTPSATGFLPPAFGGGAAGLPPGAQGGGERPMYGGRGPLSTPSGPGTSASPRTPGRGLSGPFGPGTSGTQPVPGHGAVGPGPARGTNGIPRGLPVPPHSGRLTGAIPRGTVIGGTPSQPQTPTGRGAASGGAGSDATPPRGEGRTANRESAVNGPRTPAHSGEIVGGQPKPSRQRGRSGFTSGGAGLARGATADSALPHSGGTARGASGAASHRGDRPTNDERSRGNASRQAETEDDRPSMPRLPGGA